MFSELIEVYSTACKVEQNIHVFKKLLRSFYINASAHDYDVFIALKEICKNNKQKLNVINKIEQEFREEVDIKYIRSVWYLICKMFQNRCQKWHLGHRD